jgi:hypothetical protein
MFISIVLRNVQYCPGASGISGEAVPFRPTKRYHIYKVTEATPAVSNDTTAGLLELLKKTNTGVLKSNPKIAESISPYPIGELETNSKTIGALKVVKISNLIDGSIVPPYYVAKHSRLPPLDDTVAVYQAAADSDVDAVTALFENGVLSTSANPYEAILHTYVNYLEFAVDLTEMFTTNPTLAKSHSKILDIYNSYKDTPMTRKPAKK